MFDLPLNLAVAAAIAGAPELPSEEHSPVTDEAPANAPVAQDEAAAEGEAAEEEKAWSAAITLGMSLASGNTENRNASANADAERKWGDKARLTFNFIWNYAEDQEVITQRKLYGAAQYDRFINERLYWLVQGSADADQQAGVDLRTTIGPGVGYQFLDTEKWKLSSEIGLSYFSEEFDSGIDNDYLAARVAWDWQWLPSDVFTLIQGGQAFPSLESSDDIYTRLDTRARVTLKGDLFAQLQWVWDWNNTPQSGNERSDNLYLLTLGWTY